KPRKDDLDSMSRSTLRKCGAFIKLPFTQMTSFNLLPRRPTLNQFWKPAIVAHRIRMIAKVAHDLNQPLLLRRAPQRAPRSVAKQPLPREFQNRVILSRRPMAKTAFNLALQFRVLAFECANP